jgi:hypothetical protein
MRWQWCRMRRGAIGALPRLVCTAVLAVGWVCAVWAIFQKIKCEQATNALQVGNNQGMPLPIMGLVPIGRFAPADEGALPASVVRRSAEVLLSRDPRAIWNRVSDS